MKYWSFGKNIIYAMIMLSVPVGTFAVEGFSEHIADNLAESTRQYRSRITESNLVVLAQNTTEASKDGDRTRGEKEKTSSNSSSSAKEGSGTKARETETRQVKPFKPSEEIAAEQAVDFPWDI